LATFPLSQTLWLGNIAEPFRALHDRCLALLLTMNVVERRWTGPMLPAQRCARDGAAWSIRPQDLLDWPTGTVIAGSFQSARDCSVDEFLARLPAVDGLHLFNSFSDGRWSLRIAMRVSGIVRALTPEVVFDDDCRAFLRAHHERLELV
jgi:hypothetical protein